MKISSLKKFKLFVYCTILTFLVTEISLQDIRFHENWKLLNGGECGVSLGTSIDNVEVTHGQFPWMARLGYINEALIPKLKFLCGGVLINENYVLTAAHCTFDRYRTLALVKLGEVDLTVDHLLERNTEWVQEIYISQIFRHDDYYHIPPYKHDIALLRLDKPAIINTSVKPICLPFNRIISEDNLLEPLEVIGWGATDSYGTPSVKLHHGVVSIVPLGYCTDSGITCCKYLDSIGYSKRCTQYIVYGAGHLCARGVKGYSYIAGGDSGGPLMKYSFSRYYLIGLVSLGPNPPCEYGPSAYTDVSYYLDWILNFLN